MHEQNKDENTEVTFLPAERTFEVLSAEAAGTGVNGIEKNPAVSYLMGLRAENWPDCGLNPDRKCWTFSGYLSCHSGGRFSIKAEMPSLASSLSILSTII